MPPCRIPSRASRSPTPASRIRSTVPCSSTPARTRSMTCSWLRSSTMTESMPRRCSRWPSINPAGPAPTMPTWVRRGVTSQGFDETGMRPLGLREDDQMLPGEVIVYALLLEALVLDLELDLRLGHFVLRTDRHVRILAAVLEQDQASARLQRGLHPLQHRLRL